VIQALADVHPEGATPGLLERLADDFLTRRCVALSRDNDALERGHHEEFFTTPGMLAMEVRLIEAATGRDPAGPLVADARAVEAAGRRPADARRRPGSGAASPLRRRGTRARARGARRHRQDLHHRRPARGLRALGHAGHRRGLAGAADVLAREAGIHSQTAALLLARIESGEREAIPHRSLLVVDEASAMPTRALERLVYEAAWRSSRLVLVGDRAQLPAIDAGGGFAALADRLGAARLVENRRQETQLQREVAQRHRVARGLLARPHRRALPVRRHRRGPQRDGVGAADRRRARAPAPATASLRAPAGVSRAGAVPVVARPRVAPLHNQDDTC
jgi:hypothetical protein